MVEVPPGTTAEYEVAYVPATMMQDSSAPGHLVFPTT